MGLGWWAQSLAGERAKYARAGTRTHARTSVILKPMHWTKGMVKSTTLSSTARAVLWPGDFSLFAKPEWMYATEVSVQSDSSYD